MICATPKQMAMKCLALHIQPWDKANCHKCIKLQTFLPYVQAYLPNVTDGSIYVATNSSAILE